MSAIVLIKPVITKKFENWHSDSLASMTSELFKLTNLP